MSLSARRSEAPLFSLPAEPVELRSTGQMRTSVPTWLVANTRYFGLAGCRVFGRLRFFGGSFSQSFLQVGMQFIEFSHGQLCGPLFELINIQRGVEAHSRFDVFSESGAEVARLIL